jgi:hypothetical protein
MIGVHPLKQILFLTRRLWDHAGTPLHIRKTFLSILKCGTIALGAEVYVSATERKIVYHTCKSRFCPSCGQRATNVWQEELDATLPDMPYVGITLTIPSELWPIVQENRHVLHGMPTIAAEAIKLWAKARYGVAVHIIVVQQTFGGFLNFHPHLHVLVSAGGLQVAHNRWIPKLSYDERELMRSWRYAVLAFFAEALKKKLVRSDVFGKPLMDELEVQQKREWHLFVSAAMSKAHFLQYAGRYVRRPPIARHRLSILSNRTIEYLAKDTRNTGFVPLRFSTDKFVHILKQHVPQARRHNMRYFGLLAPRSMARTSSAVFALLGQRKRPKPARFNWASLLLKSFGRDPLIDSQGERMCWVGQLNPTQT